MLIKQTGKHRLTICYFGFRLREGQEERIKGFFGEQRTPHNTHDIIDASCDFHFMLDYCDCAVGGDSSIYLYANSRLRVSPEGLYLEMLLYPLEEELHLPSVLIKEYDLLSREIEVVGVENERVSQVWNVGDDSPYSVRIIVLITLSDETYSLIHEDIPVLGHIHAILNLILRASLLAYHKEGIHLLNLVKPLQIPVTTVEDVTRSRFIVNDIHCIDIMYGSIRNMNQGWYLSDDIKLSMQFDSGLCAPKLSPIKHTHAEVDGRRVEGIELTSDTELRPDSGFLSQSYHVIGELFEHMPVAVSITSGKYRPIHLVLPKSQVERLTSVGRCDIGEFPKTATAEKLTEHEHEQLSPIRQLPAQCRILYVVLSSCSHNPLEKSLWQKVNDLTEYISSCIHGSSELGLPTKIMISKVRQGSRTLKCA